MIILELISFKKSFLSEKIVNNFEIQSKFENDLIVTSLVLNFSKGDLNNFS